ncbi:hypothetical protein DF185_00555 [Marinifilum breve]|uniref:Uncharacterized protein n=1 Tax=Marinifilum breve TaxID=2184082 RepID=A0A2V4A1X9_9BACT|nr:hypothetical protein [Marinifilum breve]PXY02618.1 hypothetical protein DF185_00555 [Marinifilum breve]
MDKNIKKRFLMLGIMVGLVVIGGLYNWQINPKTDSSIQTSFTKNEILFALILMGTVYAFYFIKKVRKLKIHQNTFEQEAEAYGEMRAPFRSAQDYRNETQNTMNSFSTQKESKAERENGKAVISAFAQGPQYIWDGMYLSKFAESKILKFDGKYISDFSGNKRFTWESNHLSEFAGKKIYSASKGRISEFSGPETYSYDNRSISKFAGPKLYTIKGELRVPEAIMIVIAADLI